MSAKALAIPFAAIALIAAAPAPSAMAGNEGGGSAEVSAKAAKPAKVERKTCRRFIQTGSHSESTRLCMTKSQWRDFDDKADD